MNETDAAKSHEGSLAAVVLAPPNPAVVVAAPTMLDLFGKPPILRTEDANLYDALLSRVVAAARPRDPFEWMLLKDYVDLAWEIFRLRRVKADCVDGARRTALYSFLKRIGLDGLAAWRSHNDPEAKATVAKQLAEHGFDEEIITHEAVMLVSAKLSSLDAMISSAEQRRNVMLREIDYHRGGLGMRLRGVADVVDAETKDAPRVTAHGKPQQA